MSRNSFAVRLVLVCFSAALLTTSVWAATFTVTNTSDSGAGSLRQAILDANTAPGADTITFSIGSGGAKLITPASLLGVRLPSTTQTIDGVSYVLATDHAASLYYAIYTDTLDQWVAENPTWVNPL